MAIAVALGRLGFLRTPVGIEAETLPPGDIGAEPEPLQSGNVVGRCRGRGKRRVSGRRHKGSVISALENKNPVRQYVGRTHSVAKPFGHSPEVFADNGAGLPPALERDYPDQLVERVVY